MCSHSRLSSFACFPLLSLLLDHSFLYHFSFIPLQTGFGPFLIPFPAFLEGFFLFANHRSLNVIQVILTQCFCLFRRFETSNLCACVRTSEACTCNIDLCFSLYIDMYVVYDNNTTMVVLKPTPNSDPYIRKLKPKLFQCPEHDPGDSMMRGRCSASTWVILRQ